MLSSWGAPSKEDVEEVEGREEEEEVECIEEAEDVEGIEEVEEQKEAGVEGVEEEAACGSEEDILMPVKRKKIDRSNTNKN